MDSLENATPDTQPRLPLTPSPSEAQVRLIGELGGPTAVARLILEKTSYPLCPQAVSMWKKRGIPFCYRAILARAAGERGVALPPNFLNGEAVPNGGTGTCAT